MECVEAPFVCRQQSVEGGEDRLRERILSIRDMILETKDSICLERAKLVTEVWDELQHEPPPVRQARILAHVLRHMTLDLHSNPFFAGNMSTNPRAWMLVPEYGFLEPPQIIHENPQLTGLLSEQVPQDMLDFWSTRSFGGNAGIGHLAVDLERVVTEGLQSLVTEAVSLLDAGDSEARTYRRAIVIALQAVIEWAERYADMAEAAAERAEDSILRALHRRVAAACRWVPAQPARTLFEGLQAIVLVHLALHLEGQGLSVSIGLPDRVLAHLIPQSPDPDALTEMIAAFLLKIHANALFGRGSKTQAITIGGVDRNGKDHCNLLTRSYLEAFDLLRVGDPHLFLRWHVDISPDVKSRAIAMLASGVSMPLLIHDVPTVRGLIDIGVAEGDAWDYCVIGCNELGIPGRSAESATATGGTIQYLAHLTDALLTHPNPDSIASVSELLDLLEHRITRRVLEMRQKGAAHRIRVANAMPMPLTSALMRGCIQQGQDFMVGMNYHFPNVYERGLTNAVNALAAIAHVVFEAQAVSLAELVAALRVDFAGYEGLRRQLRGAPKWGNDDPRVDDFAGLLLAMRERALDLADRRFGSASHTVCHVVRSLHYLDGRQIPASPDGRLAWTAVADSVGAEVGTAVGGPTAILQSVLKLDAARYYRGGTNLNLTLPAAQWQAVEMQTVLLSLVEAFFGSGGQELQVGVLDAEVLRDAQIHPEGHGDLLVRIAGFNTRFVDLAPVEQTELILRAEAFAG